MEFNEKEVTARMMKIRTAKQLTKRIVAERMGINEASYGRIETNKIALSYSHLASFASCVGMSVVDVLTYPAVYSEAKKVDNGSPEVVLQIKLRGDKKDKVLNLLYADHDIEILSKTIDEKDEVRR